MADCPKCGFTQPEDQYCANCGVDMQNYRPEPDPLVKKLSQSLGFQITMVVIIVAALFSVLYVSQKEVIEQKLRSALQNNSKEEISDEDELLEEVAQTTIEQNQPQTLSATQVQESLVPSPAPEAREPLSQLEVAFAEVPMPLVQIWANEGQILSEDSSTRSILVTQSGALSSLRRQDWEPFFLPGGTTWNVSTDSPHEARFPDFEMEIGMALQVRTQSLSAEKINFSFEAILSLPAELDESVSTSSITGTYEIPRNSILVVVGILPQTSVRGEAADAFNGTPLSVMQSPEFLAGASEFALIIRPQ